MNMRDVQRYLPKSQIQTGKPDFPVGESSVKFWQDRSNEEVIINTAFFN